MKIPEDSALFSNSYEWIGDTISFKEMLFFSADDGVNGIELWKSDGTEFGTTMLIDINSEGSSNPSNLIAVNSNLFFWANDGVNGDQLWISDGTVSGTQRISSSDETITVNNVVLVDTPPHPEWEWNYSYQTEVNDLQMDVNYTAVINIYRVEDSWEGLDWWWDIDWEGGYDEGDDGYHNQYNYTFSLQRGCYYINADLYESGPLHSDEDSAVVLASADLDFGVGGICMDGAFYPEVGDNSGTGEGGDDGDATSIPGFGLLLSITAALGTALIAARRK